jgi:hypothetical protein
MTNGTVGVTYHGQAKNASGEYCHIHTLTGDVWWIVDQTMNNIQANVTACPMPYDEKYFTSGTVTATLEITSQSGYLDSVTIDGNTV